MFDDGLFSGNIVRSDYTDVRLIQVVEMARAKVAIYHGGKSILVIYMARGEFSEITRFYCSYFNIETLF